MAIVIIVARAALEETETEEARDRAVLAAIATTAARAALEETETEEARVVLAAIVITVARVALAAIAITAAARAASEETETEEIRVRAALEEAAAVPAVRARETVVQRITIHRFRLSPAATVR